jgi:hypothetical protein
MKTADLNRFLVVCALVSRFRPLLPRLQHYNPNQSLAKDSNLADFKVARTLDRLAKAKR